jgi:PBP1b-binding outer membrane lipoprotein LpoB
MKAPVFIKKSCFAVLAATLIALLLAGCSDDKEKIAKTAPVKAVFNPFDHSHDGTVTAVEKHKFEDAFAAQCVAREIKNSVNKDIDAENAAKPCSCIAHQMVKDLTDEEVEKYLTEHENPRSLQIKFDAAAYHCTQATVANKGFTIFNAPKPKEEKSFFNKLF